jgi:transposase
MTQSWIIFPPIPADTAEIAHIQFGKGNIYLRLGEQIDCLISQLPQSGYLFPDKGSEATYYFYALLTAIQYAEGLTDHQSLEAVRNRVDLKYALHLPLNYPGIDPENLCSFRQQLYQGLPNRQALHALICQLADIGLLTEYEGLSLDVAVMLEAICTMTRLEKIIDAMYQALETLAVTHAEWLLKFTLPHWYERYGRRARILSRLTSHKERKAIACSIGKDIQYLLGEIHLAGITSISSLPEVRNLKQVKEEQFETVIKEDFKVKPMQFRSSGCVSCIRTTGVIKHEV